MRGNLGGMKLANSYIIKIANERGYGEKFWTHVYFDNGTVWIPALWEQGYVAQQVVVCERIKYPNLPWDAADKTIKFISAAMQGQNIEALCYEHELTTQPSFKRLRAVIEKSRKPAFNIDWSC